MGYEQFGSSEVENVDPLFASTRDVFVEVLGIEDPESVRPETEFAELDADSLDLVEVVSILEDNHDIKVDHKELAGIANVGQVVEYVRGKLPEDSEFAA